MRLGTVGMLIAALGLGAWAAAREPDGRLGIVVTPNNTQPALVQPGQQFEVVLRTRATLRLESSGGTYELEAGAAVPWRGWLRVECTLPQGVPRGTYTLTAEDPEAADHAFRAVQVYESFSETYTVAQLNDLRVGAEDGRDTVLYRSTRRINSAEPALVLVTGSLTAHGAADEFRVALEILNDIAAPALVVPGSVDRSQGLAETFLGPYPVTRRYGRDGYLAFFTPASATGWSRAEEGRLYMERRSIRAVRWSMGLSNRYALGSNLRDALTLFVDDPLDVIVAGSIGAPAESGGQVHWGGTRLYGPASAGRGSVRWYRVGPRGVQPLEAAE